MKPIYKQKTTWAAGAAFAMSIVSLFVDDPAIKAKIQEAFTTAIPLALIFLRQGVESNKEK